jgi:hypothetical protein
MLVFKGVHFPYMDRRDETDDIDGNYGNVHFFTRKVLFDVFIRSSSKITFF